MSMSTGRSPVRSFQSSAALPSMQSNAGSNGGSSRGLPQLSPVAGSSGGGMNLANKKESPGKLPSLNGGGSLPSIHKKPIAHKESVELAHAPPVAGKRSLAPMDANEQPAAHGHEKKEKKHKHKHHHQGGGTSNNDEEKLKAKKDRKAEERAMIKEQVAVALQAVREVFKSGKGQNILLLETKVEKAARTNNYVVTKVKRKGETDSLGISFTIPARVMALGWESGQHLVVTGVKPKPGVKSSLEIDDVVVAVDDAEVHSIDDLKTCVAGKKKMYFKCIRDNEEVSDEELQATQDRIEKGLKAAVKAKVKENLKQKRKKAESQ